MNTPFSDKLFAVTIDVGRVPKVAAILKSGVKNLRYDNINFFLPRSEIGEGIYLEPLFV